MFTIIIWLGALLCSNPSHTAAHHGNCPFYHAGTVNTLDDDTGGELGGGPRPPVPPPPPPPVGPGE